MGCRVDNPQCKIVAWQWIFCFIGVLCCAVLYFAVGILGGVKISRWGGCCGAPSLYLSYINVTIALRTPPK